MEKRKIILIILLLIPISGVGVLISFGYLITVPLAVAAYLPVFILYYLLFHTTKASVQYEIKHINEDIDSDEDLEDVEVTKLDSILYNQYRDIEHEGSLNISNLYDSGPDASYYYYNHLKSMYVSSDEYHLYM